MNPIFSHHSGFSVFSVFRYLVWLSLQEMTMSLNDIMHFALEMQTASVYCAVRIELFYITSLNDRLCGLVVRVSGYRYRGPGFDPRRYQIF